jgi:hypothetical protein
MSGLDSSKNPLEVMVLQASGSGPDALRAGVALNRIQQSMTAVGCAFLESVAAKLEVDLPSVLDRHACALGRAVLASPNPERALNRILSPGKGRKARTLVERVAIACLVDGYITRGLTQEEACRKIVTEDYPHIGEEAIRRVYENAAKGKIRATDLIARGEDEFLARIIADFAGYRRP